MSDNELDNLFKEAAEGFNVPNDPSAWKDMSGKLDQIATVTSFWNWKTIASLTVVGVISTALILYLSAPGSNADKIAASHITLNQVIEKKPADSKSANSDTETTSTSLNQKEKKLAVKENDQNKSETPSIEDGANSGRSLNANSSQTESIEDIQSEAVQSSESKQNALSSKQVTAEQLQSNKTASPENSKEKITSSENKSVQVSAIAGVAVTEKSLSAKNSSGSALNEQNLNQALNSKDYNVQTESLTVADSLEKLDEEKKVTTAEKKKVSENVEPEKNDESEIKKFAIKLAFAPDYTTVKNVTPNGMGINYGVLFEYHFSKHWSIATGGIWSKKIYSATDVKYNGYTADKVDGDCRMLDIPINVYYNFTSDRPFSFYASVGLSSYLMNEENYVFYVETPYGEYTYPQQVKGENNEWFKTLNVSMGMQYRMSQRFSIQFEPTLKAPLAGVGEGEVSLVSLGAFLNLRFDIPLNKPGRKDD